MSLRTGLVRATRLSAKPRLPLSVFLRASHDASSDTRLERFLLPLKYPDEPNAVRHHYLPLISELKRIKDEPDAPPLPPLLTRQQLITVLRAMFSHLPVYFNVPVTPDLHSVVVAALLKQGYVPLAQKWLAELTQLPPQTPTLDNFHTFLRRCPDHTSFTTLRYQVTRTMRNAGVRPTAETFSILIERIISNATVAKTVISPDTFGTIFTDMRILRVPSNPEVIDLIVGHYMDLGFTTMAETIRGNYFANFPAPLTPEEEQRSEWNVQLAEAAQDGVEESLTLFRELQSTEGCAPTAETFRAVLRGSTTIEDLRRAEEVLGIKADAPEYAVLVHNNIRMKRLDEAMAVYEESRNSGIVPVAGLVGPLIRSLCASDRKKPAVHNAHLDSALALYSDLDEAFPPSDPDTPEALAAYDHSKHSFGPDIDIYTSLLHGLAMSTNIQASYPIAGALAQDMKARGIQSTSSIRTSNIIMEMRNAGNLEGAFKCYRMARSELGEAGYGAVLHAFSRLSFSVGHPDHLEYYFLIVGDMRLAGFMVTARIYTDILQQFAEVAAVRRKAWRRAEPDKLRIMPSNIFDDLLSAVRQVHNLLSLDTMITRDNVLWNQLMDTYQRLGSFPEAFRVWEMLFFSGAYGPVAVSIIFDACGYAKKFESVQAIARGLMAESYVFNLHNWNSYIECLCRLNQMSEALRVIEMDMGSDRQPVKPDPSTVSIMLKFAESRLQTNITLQRIRRQLPELWQMLPQNTQTAQNAEKPPDYENPLDANLESATEEPNAEPPDYEDPLDASPLDGLESASEEPSARRPP
ncbi:hypothetical protein B0H16DRAFT_1490691 [Mycena metata]|uniref:Pentatricopeptide repeat-containing protein n=1 Tax=Mycena metata TaxID=1033252 RepID=A0AAD7KJT8_9AGAR|nr:hypothetical protein B0H16DRAFT_1490691 [Mycena metata]